MTRPLTLQTKENPKQPNANGTREVNSPNQRTDNMENITASYNRVDRWALYANVPVSGITAIVGTENTHMKMMTRIVTEGTTRLNIVYGPNGSQ